MKVILSHVWQLYVKIRYLAQGLAQGIQVQVVFLQWPRYL